MPRIGGYAFLTENATGNVIAECNTYRCNHCGFTIHAKVKTNLDELGGMCWGCSRMVCARCHDKPGCDELERKLDRVEKSNDMRRWFMECT